MGLRLIGVLWYRFWFRTIDARQFAALRILFGGLSLIYLVELIPYAALQFSSSGWLDGIRQLAQQNGGSWSLFFFVADKYADMFAYTTMIVGISASFLLMLGWHSRFMAGISWMVWVSLWNRNPLILDGDDALLKLMCFYLLLSPCGNCWSLDAILQNKPQRSAIWPLRLIQFQIALLYFVSGWVKFHSPEWLDGSVIRYILIHPHYSRWDGWSIINQPLFYVLSAGLAGFIWWWELLFPLLLLNQYSRRLTLIIGIAFHIGLLVTMNLRWFPIVMLSLYPGLISDCHFSRLEKKLFKLAVSIR
jgi:uncharacterized membrane protein YphA (DoxX/SURF4 family)